MIIATDLSVTRTVELRFVMVRVISWIVLFGGVTDDPQNHTN
jgi:hypothetical protein